MINYRSKSFENRLTEKKMHDKRFRDNEIKIRDIYTKHDQHPSLSTITHKTKLSKSTFYRHHKAVTQVPQDYADFLLKQFNKSVGKLAKRKGSRLKYIYLRMLFFIINHREELKIFQQGEDHEIFAQMVKALDKKIISAEHLPLDSDKILTVYHGEIAEILVAWTHQGAPMKRLNTVLRDIIYLTNSIKPRLGPLRETSIDEAPEMR